MEKNQVTEEMRPQDKWFEKAKQIKTPEELAAFAVELFDKTSHDYGTVCHAVAAVALAGAWLGCEKEGITGFQAGFVMWDFIRQWNYTSNECGLRIINYDNMLYPQYEENFEKTISEKQFKQIQEVAAKRIKESETGERGYGAHPDVLKHWKSIVDGVVPFGFTLTPSED